MKTIWKYELDMRGGNDFLVPLGARVIHVGRQFGIICIWAEVDDEQPKEPRSFTIVGTGHPRPFKPSEYLGTVFTDDGRYVWHIYELRR